ncbi:MAG TPA: hypothetical protein VM934_11535 [Pyrinomonadaceae bacterium]|nr:hypothetical protein [Pyrinomonadaceae bacterium]
MLSIVNKTLPALVLALFCCVSNAAAQQAKAPGAASAEDNAISEKGFRNRVFEIKYRDPNTLVGVLYALGSGFKGATITHSQTFKTITVRDFPENIATIEEAIKRLDTPEPSRPDIEFRVHILIASNGGTGTSQFPAELTDVLKQLQSTLSYKNYSLMTSQVLRTKEGPTGVSNKGVAELKLSTETAASNNPIFYEYRLSMISLEDGAAGASKVQIGNFNFAMRIPLNVSAASLQYESIGFTTPVSVRQGEKVVVGTTTMQDKGIIIVLAANMMK